MIKATDTLAGSRSDGGVSRTLQDRRRQMIALIRRPR
jgi:hypothetical protein